MSDYRAPIQDMRFVMDELADLPGIARLPGFEEATPDMADAILEEAAKFTGEVLAPLNAIGDREGCRWQNGAVSTPPGWKEAYRQYCEGGWNGIACSPAFGGQGLPNALAVAVKEMVCSANLAFSVCPLLTTGAIEALMTCASGELIETYLAKMISGEWTGTMNLTEPQAGSDLALLRSRAEPQADGTYRIFGQKLFLVPKVLVNADGSLGARNDVACASIEHKLGIHGSPTCVMAFGEQGGAVGYLLGQANRGLEYMFVMMNEARHGVGLQGVALGERAYQHALAYAAERKQGRDAVTGEALVTIDHHPDVKRMLMLMKSRVEAARALAYYTAGLLDRSHAESDEDVRQQQLFLAEFLIPLVKGGGTEMGIDVTSLGIQIHGGMGFIEETGAAQFWRDARITTIYEGTTGIQANDLIFRKLLRDRGATAQRLFADIERTVSALRSHADVSLNAIGKSLQEGLGQWREVTRCVLASAKSQPEGALTAAVPILSLAVTVSNGWMMGRAALIARQRLDEGHAATEFLLGKCTSARFYSDHVMPLAGAYAATALNCLGG